MSVWLWSNMFLVRSLFRRGAVCQQQGGRCMGYWWGHDPVSREKRIALAEANQPIRWNKAPNELGEVKQVVYDPAVIKNEYEMGNEVNQERMNFADTLQWVGQPIPYFQAITVIIAACRPFHIYLPSLGYVIT